MIRIAIAFSSLLAAMFASASFAQEQDSSPEPTVTLRGTAVAPNGEAAADIPIRVTVPAGHGLPRQVTVVEGRTAADGTFTVEFADRGFGFVIVHFGDKYETNWGAKEARLTEVHASGIRRHLSKVDLGTVKLRPPAERRPERNGSSLCFVVAILLLIVPVGLLLHEAAGVYRPTV